MKPSRTTLLALAAVAGGAAVAALSVVVAANANPPIEYPSDPSIVEIVVQEVRYFLNLNPGPGPDPCPACGMG
jgi:hypothetical protein